MNVSFLTLFLFALIVRSNCDAPCPFPTPQCSCYIDPFRSIYPTSTDVNCYSDNASFPTFYPLPPYVSNMYVIRTLTVAGLFQNIPNYAFNNIRPQNIVLKRKGDPQNGLTIALNAFQYLNDTGNYSTSFDTIKFDNFITLLQVPMGVLQQCWYIRELSFRGSSFGNLYQSFSNVRAASITLENCAIYTLDRSAFVGAGANLAPSLDLSNNLLTAVPTAALGATIITQVSLANNLITSLPDNAFNSSYNVAWMAIVLDGNPIGDNISISAFNNIQYLSTLSLSKVGLNSIPIDALRSLAPSLEQLDFGFNNILTIPINMFEKFSNLHTLKINNNPILNLQPGSLAGIRTANLAIDYLPVSSLDISVTKGVTALQNLRVENCPNLKQIFVSDVNALPYTLRDVYVFDTHGSPTIENIDPNFEPWLKSNSNNRLLLMGANHLFVCNSDMFWLAEYMLCPPYQITLDKGGCATNGQTVREYLEANVNVTCIPYHGGCRKNVVENVMLYLLSFLIFKTFFSIF